MKFEIEEVRIETEWEEEKRLIVKLRFEQEVNVMLYFEKYGGQNTAYEFDMNSPPETDPVFKEKVWEFVQSEKGQKKILAQNKVRLHTLF